MARAGRCELGGGVLLRLLQRRLLLLPAGVGVDDGAVPAEGVLPVRDQPDARRLDDDSGVVGPGHPRDDRGGR